MTTPSELAVRVLRKIKVLSAQETASAEDLAVAVQAIVDAHSTLDTLGLLRWTLADIPRQVEPAYVALAAFHAADEFVVPKDAAWTLFGVRAVQAYVHVPLEPAACARSCMPTDYQFGDF